MTDSLGHSGHSLGHSHTNQSHSHQFLDFINHQNIQFFNSKPVPVPVPLPVPDSDSWGREFISLGLGLGGGTTVAMGAPTPMVSGVSHSEWSREFLMSRDFTRNNQNNCDSSRILNLSDSDWSREFEEVLINNTHGTGIISTSTHDNISTHDAWALEFKNAANGYVDDKDHDWQAQFEDLWSRMKLLPQDNSDPAAVAQNWEKEFRDLLPSMPGDVFPDSWNESFNASTIDPTNSFKDPTNSFEDPTNSFDPLVPESPLLSSFDPVLSECALYSFEPVNPYLDHPSPFEEGTAILAAQGSLSAACLALEAAVQRDPTNDVAWLRLGMAQAENEKEGPAIAALQRCVQENPGNMDALMSLAVSYTNEGQLDEAHASLYRWITTRYPDVPVAPLDSSTDRHSHLVATFLHHIQTQSHTTTLVSDADIQIGLGLLFYNVHDYEKTIDCFKAAVAARPTDYLMWNRLGATLSNSGDNEGAIDAYYKVLQLKPNFVRGRYNLGVSCMNIGCFREAAEHFLSALALHVVVGDGKVDGGGVHVSKTLWDTLHRNFVMMDRRDLAELASAGKDVQVFKKEFDF